MQDLITVWNTGLFYSKCMTVLWIAMPFIVIIITFFIENRSKQALRLLGGRIK